MSPPAIFVELVPSTPSDPNKDAPDGDGLLRLSIEPGQTLAQALYLSDRLRPPVLCSGLACCGRCRVRVLNGAQASSAISDAEKRFFPGRCSRKAGGSDAGKRL